MEMTEHPTEGARQETRSPMSSATPLVALRNTTREESLYPIVCSLGHIFSRATHWKG